MAGSGQRSDAATASSSSPLLPEDDTLAEMCARYGRLGAGAGRDSDGGSGGGSADGTGRCIPTLIPAANVLVASAAAAFGAALYANTLSHEYTFDDFAAVQDNADVMWTTPFMSTLVSLQARCADTNHVNVQCCECLCNSGAAACTSLALPCCHCELVHPTRQKARAHEERQLLC